MRDKLTTFAANLLACGVFAIAMTLPIAIIGLTIILVGLF